jgi:hypothetical protein
VWTGTRLVLGRSQSVLVWTAPYCQLRNEIRGNVCSILWENFRLREITNKSKVKYKQKYKQNVVDVSSEGPCWEVRACLHGGRATQSGGWPNLEGDPIRRVTLSGGWPYQEGDPIRRVTQSGGWPNQEGDPIRRVTQSGGWPNQEGDPIRRVTLSGGWP